MPVGQGRRRKVQTIFAIEIAAFAVRFAAAWGETCEKSTKCAVGGGRLARWRSKGETCHEPPVPREAAQIFFCLA
jgi:hypothetical protein